eukprot:g4323.t1
MNPPVTAGTAMAAVASSTAAWANQPNHMHVFASESPSTSWNNAGRPFYQGRSAFDRNTSPIAQHSGEGDTRPDDRGGGANAGGSGHGTTPPPPSPGPSATVEAGLRCPTETPSVLAERVQYHLHALASLFFNCSRHEERPSMADMAKAEEQLSAASEILLELQQRLVEVQHQAYPRPGAHPHVVASRLPREDSSEGDASAFEEHTNISAPSPRKDPRKHFTYAWAAETEMPPVGNLRLETRPGGIVAGRSPGGVTRTVDYEWQGGQGGHGEAAEVGDATFSTFTPGVDSSTAICSLSSPDNDVEPRRRLPKAPSLEIMRGEHDLSEYCLQDEGGSQIDGGDAKDLGRTAEEEYRPALRGDDALLCKSYGERTGQDDSDDPLGVLGCSWRSGGSDHTPTAAAAAAAAGAAATAGAKGVRVRSCGRGEDAREGGAEGDKDVNDKQDSGSDGYVEGNVDDASCGFGASRGRPALDSEGTAPARQGEGEAAAAYHNRTGGFKSRGSNNNRPQKPSATGHARGSSAFFPQTDDGAEADDDRGRTRQTTSYPSSATSSAAAEVTRKDHLSGHGGGGGGIHNRRRSSGVSEEILTSGARALAEAAASARTTAAAWNSSRQRSRQESEGEAGSAGFSGDFTSQRHDEEGGGQRRLGPDEATPTSGSAYAAVSTATSRTEYRRRQEWPQEVGVDNDGPTPRLYGGNPNASFPTVVVGVDVDERAHSPASADAAFRPNGPHPHPHHTTLSLGSTELPGGGSAERKQASFGRCARGPLLNEGCTTHAATPRHKATVADVQEAFERADTRLAKEAARSPRSESSEGGCQQSRRQLRGGGDVVDGPASSVAARGAGLKACSGCDDEDGNLNSTFRQIWRRESDVAEDSRVPVSTPKLRPASTSSGTTPSAGVPFTAMRYFQATQTQQHHDWKLQHSQKPQLQQGALLQQEGQQMQLYQSGDEHGTLTGEHGGDPVGACDEAAKDVVGRLCHRAMRSQSPTAVNNLSTIRGSPNTSNQQRPGRNTHGTKTP